MMPGLIRGEPAQKLRAAGPGPLDEVGLGHRVTHRPGELSGGEQQRVALARALVMEPKLILADEPTGNLDSKTSEQIHKLFIDLNESRGTTFLIVTHSMDLASRMGRTVSMRDGTIEQDVRHERAALPSELAETSAAETELAETSPDADVGSADAPSDEAPAEPPPEASQITTEKAPEGA